MRAIEVVQPADPQILNESASTLNTPFCGGVKQMFEKPSEEFEEEEDSGEEESDNEDTVEEEEW